MNYYLLIPIVVVVFAIFAFFYLIKSRKKESVPSTQPEAPKEVSFVAPETKTTEEEPTSFKPAPSGLEMPEETEEGMEPEIIKGKPETSEENEESDIPSF